MCKISDEKKNTKIIYIVYVESIYFISRVHRYLDGSYFRTVADSARLGGEVFLYSL